MQELLAQAEEYRRKHPEVDGLLKQFGISREQYERYIALITAPLPPTEPMSTSEGSYNANVSAVSR